MIFMACLNLYNQLALNPKGASFESLDLKSSGGTKSDQLGQTLGLVLAFCEYRRRHLSSRDHLAPSPQPRGLRALPIFCLGYY
jgi:hypothetical protein